MDNKEKDYVEICVGIGTDQLTPQYIRIPKTKNDGEEGNQDQESDNSGEDSGN